MKTVVLLSGGLDSALVLAMRHAVGDECHALSFHYGQRHYVEVEAAKKIAKSLYAASHRVIRIDPEPLSSSALTDWESVAPIPKNRTVAQMTSSVAPTYVPARNTIFTAFAMAVAETVGAGAIALGINALDYSGYPDCRPEWLEAMRQVVRQTRVPGQIELLAPLIAMSKADIVRHAVTRGVPIELTLSCYDPDPRPCGTCDSCLLREAAFREAGAEDPALPRWQP